MKEKPNSDPDKASRALAYPSAIAHASDATTAAQACPAASQSSETDEPATTAS